MPILKNSGTLWVKKKLKFSTARPLGYFNYDKPLTGFLFPRLWVILIMGRENYLKGKFSLENLNNTCIP
jgi:hypothetical protein